MCGNIIRPVITSLILYLPLLCHCCLCCACHCVTAYRQRFTHLNRLLWITANKAWGSLLTNGEPWRSQRALSGGLHPNLQDRGNFPIEMRSRCLSFSVSLSRCLTDSVSVSLPHWVKPGPLERNMSTMGRVAVPEHDHMTKEPFFWEALPLGTELWAHGAGPRAPNFLMEKRKQGDLIKRHVLMIPT